MMSVGEALVEDAVSDCDLWRFRQVECMESLFDKPGHIYTFSETP